MCTLPKVRSIWGTLLIKHPDLVEGEERDRCGSSAGVLTQGRGRSIGTHQQTSRYMTSNAIIGGCTAYIFIIV